MRNVLIISILGGLVSLLFVLSCTKRQPEEVEYASSIPNSPYPPDASNNINHTTTDVTLSWQCTDKNGGTLCYTVYFDTLNPPLTEVASNIFAQSCFIDSLEYNTVYYWKVVAQNEEGVNTAGPVWAFTTLPHPNIAPDVPVYSIPVDGATSEYPTLNFAWSSADPDGESDTLSYDIYLGTSMYPPLYCAGYRYPSFLQESLLYSTKYYWKIVARDNHDATTAGPTCSFTTRECPWYYKEPMPVLRKSFATAVVNEKIYLMGGCDIYDVPLSLVEEYDPASDNWTKRTDLPTPRQSLGAAVYNNMIYTFGGNSNKIEVYDPATNSWTLKNNAPFVMETTYAQTFNNKIYINSRGIKVYDPAGDTWWDTTYVIEGDTVHTWTKPNFPTGRLILISGQLYFVQGSSDLKLTEDLVSIWQYDPSGDSCISVSGFIAPYVPCSYGLSPGDNGLYILGGYRSGYYSKCVYKFDPLTGALAPRSDMQAARSQIKTAFANNRIYAFGGLNAVWLPTVEEYHLDEDPKNTPGGN
jgi:hypothetical protein